MAENTALLEKKADVQASIRANENNVTLEQVIDDHVRKKLLEVVSVKSEDTNTKIAELAQKKGVLETQIKEYDTSGRKSLLNQEFASFTQTASYLWEQKELIKMSRCLASLLRQVPLCRSTS